MIDLSKDELEDGEMTVDPSKNGGMDYRKALIGHTVRNLKANGYSDRLKEEDYEEITEYLNQRYDGIMEEELEYSDSPQEYHKEIEESWETIEENLTEKLGSRDNHD